jgi:hypothetical protein
MATALGDHHHPLPRSKCEWRGFLFYSRQQRQQRPLPRSKRERGGFCFTLGNHGRHLPLPCSKREWRVLCLFSGQKRPPPPPSLVAITSGGVLGRVRCDYGHHAPLARSKHESRGF